MLTLYNLFSLSYAGLLLKDEYSEKGALIIKGNLVKAHGVFKPRR